MVGRGVKRIHVDLGHPGLPALAAMAPVQSNGFRKPDRTNAEGEPIDFDWPTKSEKTDRWAKKRERTLILTYLCK